MKLKDIDDLAYFDLFKPPIKLSTRSKIILLIPAIMEQLQKHLNFFCDLENEGHGQERFH